jgi:hypothetical protein
MSTEPIPVSPTGGAPLHGDESPATPRFPHEPYPGLRPFLDFEAALLCGRGAQIAEVLGHLTRKQFVAVIGGSGSGKSSLVRAGVVPALRSYGIRGAGDFWVPMVCTPGTNARDGAAPNAASETPLTRFAWKFSQLLRALATDEAEAQRVEQIAALLRRDGGFAQVVEAYSTQLLPRTGLRGADARFLMVIDQFEELFHPTNRDASGRLIEDGRLLVERIIDHFFAPNPRCFVVLTMRSEHLNDCAGFLELPDAINEASYLVRRLDDEQLHDAIVEPARSYLRVRQREAREGDHLPGDIRFEDRVLERLLDDVRDIAHDPDHLPLLQHVLSRSWDVALERCPANELPAVIGGDDLARAVMAHADGSWSSLGRENVLRQCLVNHAECIYAAYSKAEQVEIDQMLRALAFKDPNTGMYSQQRINVTPANHDRLRTLVDRGLIGKVNYLHWDKDNPTRVTLKVSHESFIRGWPHFRELIDREAERFDELLQALRACARWDANQRKNSLLLEGAQLRSFTEEKLDEVARDPIQRARWFGLLAFLRDGQRYRELETLIEPFVEQSIQQDRDARDRAIAQEKKLRELEISLATAEAERKAQQLQKREIEISAQLTQVKLAESQARAGRATLAWRLWATVLLFVLPVSLFWLVIEMPVRGRIEAFFHDLESISNVGVAFREQGTAAAQEQLARALVAADELGPALSGKPGDLELHLPGMVGTLSAFPGVTGRLLFFDDVRTAVEPRVNGTLRQLLTGYPWPISEAPVPELPALPLRTCKNGDPGGAANATGSAKPPGAPAAPGAMGMAAAGAPSASVGDDVQGTVYVSRSFGNRTGTPHALMATKAGDDGQWEIRPVTVSTAAGDAECTVGPLMWTSPPSQFNPAVAFDETLTYMFLRTDFGSDVSGPAGTLSVEELSWQRDGNGRGWVVGRQPPIYLQDKAVLAMLRSRLGDRQHMALPTTPSMSGVTVNLGEGHGWRLLSIGARDLASSGAAEFHGQTLEPAQPGHRCSLLMAPLMDEARGRLYKKESARVAVYPLDDKCVAIARGVPGLGYTPAGYDAVLASVYLAPRETPKITQPIASISFGFQRTDALRWTVSRDGPFNGWIALDTSGNPAGGGLVAAPWSTAALRAVALSLQKAAPPSLQPGAPLGKQ